MPRPIPRPTDKPVKPREDRSRLDSLVQGYLRTTPEVVKTQAVNNPFNPLPSVTQAVMEGRKPTGAEAGMDAGFLAAGLIPFGKAARPAMQAIETAAAQQARRNAIMRLLNKEGPDALSMYLDYPMLAYRGGGRETMDKFFRETAERIPSGTMMYRAPSAGQVMPKRGSQSVPLPREVGAEWVPGRIQSAAGPEDLQNLGRVLEGKAPTGGSQEYAPGIVQIEAMQNIPGIYDLNAYFKALEARGLNRFPKESTFMKESVLGPQTRYVVRDFNPSGTDGIPTWLLQAYAR